jgi:hypothetical protein
MSNVFQILVVSLFTKRLLAIVPAASCNNPAYKRSFLFIPSPIHFMFNPTSKVRSVCWSVCFVSVASSLRLSCFLHLNRHFGDHQSFSESSSDISATSPCMPHLEPIGIFLLRKSLLASFAILGWRSSFFSDDHL